MKTYKVLWEWHGCLKLKANSEEEVGNVFEEMSPYRILKKSVIESDYSIEEVKDMNPIERYKHENNR